MPHVLSRAAAPATALAVLAALATSAAPAGAQSLGPFRQFLAVEPYYVNTQLDDGGTGAGRTGLHGYGARLWINAAPFVGSRGLAKSSASLFVHAFPKRDGRGALHYGAAIDQFLVHRPLGGVIDPFLSLAVGGYQTRTDVFVRGRTGARVFGATEKLTHLAVTPGVGVRVPIPNRLELRVDARDALVMNLRDARGERRTLNNFEFAGGLGITF